MDAIVSNMSKRPGFRIFLAKLMLCLFLASLVSLPVVHMAGTDAPEMFGIHLENHSLFDQSEIDDDLFILSSIDLITGVLLFLKFRGTNLDLQSAFLSPAFRPPKSS